MSRDRVPDPGNEHAREKLSKILESGRAIAFVGAGASAGLYPLWAQLIRQLAEEAVNRGLADAGQRKLWVEEYAAKRPHQAVRGIREALSEGTYFKLLGSFFGPKKGNDGRAFTAVHELLLRLPFRGYVTTNYDPSLAEARQAVCRGSAVGCTGTWQDTSFVHNWLTGEIFQPGNCPLLYLHGYYERPQTIVLGAGEYRQAYRQGLYREVFKKLWTQEHLVFVGFGFSDPWLNFVADEVLTEIEARTADEPRHIAIVAVAEGETVSAERRRAEQDQYNSLLLTYPVRSLPDGGQDHAQLLNVLQSVAPRPGSRPAPTPRAPSKPGIPSEYTAWLLARCGEVELMGLELKHGLGVRLNHVYTPLATSARPEEAQRLPGKHGGELVAGDKDAKPLLLDLLNKQSLYVWGNPGSGKSTFCRWVTLLACHGAMPPVDVPAPEGYGETFPDQLRSRLPVYVRLSDFWQHLPPGGRSIGLGGLEQAFERWLADQKYPGMDWACLRAHLEDGTALLMLDGVDEVPPVRKTDHDEWYPREMMLAGFAEAVARWTKAGNRVLVTSRPYGLDSEQERKLALAAAPILGLDQTLQGLLVRRWFIRLKEGRDLGLETAAAMTDHIHAESGLDELAANPLLLTAMCIIYDEGKRLPHDKYLLYDRIVDTVLHKRYPVKERIEPIRGRLKAIALGMHCGVAPGQLRVAPEASASVHEIDAMLQAYQQVDGETDKGLSDTVRAREDLLSQSGLLVPRGDGKASFYHLSIQEFLAAERLHLLHVRNWDGLIELLAARGRTRGWRNTLSFLFGCLVDKSSPHFGIQCLRAVAKRMLLPTEAPSRCAPSEDNWTLAIVFGDCLQILVGREAALPDDVTDVFQKCVNQAIDREIAVHDRHTLSAALGRLGDPRIVVDLRWTKHPGEHPGYVKIPAGTYRLGDEKQAVSISEPFWLSKYPVTNSQFDQFIQDGGYARQDLWSDEGWRWVKDKTPAAPALWRNPEFNAPNQPVVGVSWWEAEAFCKWAGGVLPTEQQWEAAARGPQGLEYPWGDEWESGICNSERKLDSTSAVGIFPRDKSPFGLHDMAGNVWEWCADLVGKEATFRVIRGGGWWVGSERCRSAARRRFGPASRDGFLGFRVAAVPLGPDQENSSRVRAEPGA